MEQQLAPSSSVESARSGGWFEPVYHRWLIAMIVLILCVVYWQTLTFDFVTYDDYELVYQNESFISHPSNIITAFQTHAFTTHRAESAYYRPLLLTSYILDYQLWKLAPWGYHLVNLLFHIVASVCVLSIVYNLTNDMLIALCCGLLFSLHPVQTESVAWIAGRNDLMLGAAVLLSFLSYMNYRRLSNRSWLLIVSILFFILALFTKESAVFYVLVFPWYDICCFNESWTKKLSIKNIFPYFLYGIAIAAYIIVRTTVIGAVIGAEKLYGGIPLVTRLLQSPGLFTEYISLLLFPFRLSVVHPVGSAFWLQSPWNWGAGVLIIVMVFLLIWSWQKNRLVCFGLGWLVIGLFPALDLIPVAVPILEHRLYLPMAGFVIAFVSGISMLMQAFHRPRTVVVVLVAVIIMCGMLSYLRLPVWKNSETMWGDAIEKAPTYSRSYFNLAGYYYEHQQYDRTIDLMKIYLNLNPTDQMGYGKLQQTYLADHRFFDAAQVSRTRIPFHPLNPSGYLETAKLYLRANLPESAIVVCNSGLAAVAVPNSFILHDMMGHVYSQLQNDTLAERHFKEALTIYPGFASSQIGLGVLYARRGDRADAIAFIEAGMKSSRLSDDVVRLLFRLYIDSNQKEKVEMLRERYKF